MTHANFSTHTKILTYTIFLNHAKTSLWTHATHVTHAIFWSTKFLGPTLLRPKCAPCQPRTHTIHTTHAIYQTRYNLYFDDCFLLIKKTTWSIELWFSAHSVVGFLFLVSVIVSAISVFYGFLSFSVFSIQLSICSK